MRPVPRPAFAAELDERAAAGFPRRTPMRRVSGWVDRVRGVPPRRLLLPAGGVALAAVAVATAFAVSEGATDESAHRAPVIALRKKSAPNDFEATAPPVIKERSIPLGRSAPMSEETVVEPEASRASAAHAGGFSDLDVSHRAVERSAELGLAASPGDVESDAAQVSQTVHRFDGIVTQSSTTEGRNAGAYFNLLIPSAKVDDALNALSEIDRVRTRHEASADITRPTVSLSDRLEASEARVESLLSQLAGAESEGEREAVEEELTSERRREVALRRRLTGLHSRANFSRVEVRIEVPAADAVTSGSWGFDDALHDAGQILSAAAGVLLIALVVLGPLALIALLVWLAYRAWLSRARRRALG
jgi:hypothetical protein